MSVPVSLLCYVLLMLALALMVRWAGVRRQKGPSLKPGNLNQISSRPTYNRTEVRAEWPVPRRRRGFA